MISLENKTTCASVKEKKQFKVPHTLVIVTAILVLVAIATWIGACSKLNNPWGVDSTYENESFTTTVFPKSFKGKELLMIPVIMGLFSLGGAVFGMTEEAIPFIAMLIPLCLALGYDSIMAMALSYMGCIVGFATAMLNPFSVGIAQSIAQVPAGTGVGFRTTLNIRLKRWLSLTK